MIRRVLSLGACLALLLAALVPMSATAHKSVKLGRYDCWDWYYEMPTGTYLKIVDSNSYKFMADKKQDELISKGRFVHDGEKIRFKSGYFFNKNYKATHSVSSGTHGIHLKKDVPNGIDIYYICTN